MRLLIAALLTALPGTVGTVSFKDPGHSGELASPAAKCARTSPSYANRDGQPLKPHKLTELPPAHAFSAVYRMINGCEAPILIKYRIGE